MQPIVISEHLRGTQSEPCAPGLAQQQLGEPVSSTVGVAWVGAGVFHDPYERINFWSHFLPGVALVVLGYLSHTGAVIGGRPLAIFCVAAAITHLCSATTHVWPDDHLLEKLDHLGITALILGTPFTAALAKDPEGDFTVMGLVAVGLIIAAFFTPVLRTISFVALGAVMFFYYYQVVNLNLGIQVCLYLAGAYSFVQNGGHDRWTGLTDHHLLHYWVSVACCMHVFYIRDAVQHQIHHNKTD